MRKAAIDIGTNSTRLLITDMAATSYQTLVRQAKITRLGERVNDTNHISPLAMERTLRTLMIYKGIIDSYGRMSINVASTSAARDADNINYFCKLVKKETGFVLNVISSEKEAENAFLGATYALMPDKYYLVIDIGGGSTEIIVGMNREPKRSFSKNIGCVRLFEKFIKNDPPSEEEIKKLESYVKEVYSDPILQLKEYEISDVICTAGTVTTLSAINKNLSMNDPNTVHHSRLSINEIKKVFKNLAKMNMEERKKVPTMEDGREDVIIAGSAILISLLEMIDRKSVLVSETDVLDGLMINS